MTQNEDNRTQFGPVGKPPTYAELLIGALMFSSPNEVRTTLARVQDSDVDEPAATVLSTVRALAIRDTPPSPQLVKDDLMRRGAWTRPVAVWVNQAITSGACDSARQHYAAAVVSQAFRNQVESFGAALKAGSKTSAEVEVAHLAEQAAQRVASIFERLQCLRGGAE